MIIITIIIILIIFYYANKDNKPDSKNKEKRASELSTASAVKLNSKPLNSFQKFDLDYDYVLDTFIFNDGHITITMLSGKQISSSLDHLTVHFQKIKSYFSYIGLITIEYEDTIINLREVSGILTKKEWELVFKRLSLANTTYGADCFFK